MTMQEISKSLDTERQLCPLSPPTEMAKTTHTKIKKKCLEKNPHLLASIIKKKNETLNKEELYKYVNRLISKVDHKN